MATKKYVVPAQRLVVFGVYRKFVLFGKPCRTLEVAFPSLDQAEDWVKENTTARHEPADLWMVEEMDARMRAWDGK